MKKAIVVSLVALLVNSVRVFVSAQTLPPATEKNFPAAYDASVEKTMAMFPDLPGIVLVVIKDDKPIFLRAYGMADKEAGIKAETDTLFTRAPRRSRLRRWRPRCWIRKARSSFQIR